MSQNLPACVVWDNWTFHLWPRYYLFGLFLDTQSCSLAKMYNCSRIHPGTFPPCHCHLLLFNSLTISSVQVFLKKASMFSWAKTFMLVGPKLQPDRSHPNIPLLSSGTPPPWLFPMDAICTHWTPLLLHVPLQIYHKSFLQKKTKFFQYYYCESQCEIDSFTELYFVFVWL